MTIKRFLILILLSSAAIFQGCDTKRTTVFIQAPEDTTNTPQSNGSTFLPGNEGGNGGGTFTDDHNAAWFMSSESTTTIRTCLEISDDFGLSRDEALVEIKQSFDSWQSYMEKKDVKLNAAILGKVYRPVSKPTFVDCQEAYDLKIYLGGTPIGFDPAKTEFDTLLGFSQRQSFDNSKGWGQGFIWIAPNNSVSAHSSFPKWDKDTFRAMMTHEIGHTLGCEHVDGTIMRSNIVNYLKFYPVMEGSTDYKGNRKSVYSIDGARTLLLQDDLTEDPLSWTVFKSELVSNNVNGIKAMNTIFGGVFAPKVNVAVVQYPIDQDMMMFRMIYSEQEYNFLLDQGKWLAASDVRYSRYPVRKNGQTVFDIPMQRKPRSSITTNSIFKMSVGTSHNQYGGGAVETYVGTALIGDTYYTVEVLKNGDSAIRVSLIYGRDDIQIN